MFYAFWIIITILSSGAIAWFAKLANDNRDWTSTLIATSLMVSVSWVWPVVAKYSNRLLFDTMLFDLILILSYAGFLTLFGVANKFNVIQYTGLGACVLGLILLKTGG